MTEIVNNENPSIISDDSERELLALTNTVVTRDIMATLAKDFLKNIKETDESTLLLFESRIRNDHCPSNVNGREVYIFPIMEDDNYSELISLCSESIFEVVSETIYKIALFNSKIFFVPIRKINVTPDVREILNKIMALEDAIYRIEEEYDSETDEGSVEDSDDEDYEDSDDGSSESSEEENDEDYEEDPNNDHIFIVLQDDDPLGSFKTFKGAKDFMKSIRKYYISTQSSDKDLFYEEDMMKSTCKVFARQRYLFIGYDHLDTIFRIKKTKLYEN